MMSCTGGANCECGCCAGIRVQTPQAEVNRAGLPAISYRAGSWATFKESMLARLSSSDYPALTGLKTRDDDDFTIAFLDAAAVVLDILTFYQERLANENYLRTAVQLQSAIELSRLIGYVPTPGIAAACYVAFTLKTAPGQAPAPAAPAITIPQGTQMQSVPGQDQTPQTFETAADIPAKPDWNALPVMNAQPWKPRQGEQSVYLQGTATQLQPGDLVLIVGDERVQSTTDPHWDIRVVSTVTPDQANNRTHVTWSEGLGGGGVGPAQEHPKFYALRQRASLFGYNAISPQMLAKDTLSNIGGRIEPLPAPSPHSGGNGSGYFVGDQVTVDGGAGGVLQVIQVQNATFGPAPVAQLSVFSGGMGYTKSGSLGTTIQDAATFGGAGSGLTVDFTAGPNLLNSSLTDWYFQPPGSTLIDLDATYSKLVVDGWIALIHPDANIARSPAGFIRLYLIKSISTVARSAYSTSAKISRADVDTGNYLNEYYGYTRETIALAQSEELAVIPQPLIYPLYGAVVELQDLRSDLSQATVVAITGPRQKLAALATSDVNSGKVQFVPDDGSTAATLNPGDIVTITDPTPLPANPADWNTAGLLTLIVLDSSGRPGTVQSDLGNFALSPSTSKDPQVSECVRVSVSASTDPFPHTVLTLPLKSSLQNCYDRQLTSVNANVVLANAGQSVGEVLGSGSASTPDQFMTLKQSPLTYIQALTPTGRQSTLQVQVNGVKWTEAPSLYQQPPSAQVFTTLTDSSAKTEVIFGDGVEGATLPTGQNNVQANYRIGSGAAGNVSAGTLTTLIDRPLGVSGVTNPQDATGGQDPQSLNDVRANAPQTVLTLGRAVSITDYQNYAATFAGIAKAYAIWIPAGPSRGVFLTVAGINGADLTGSPTLDNLATSLRSFGNPLIPITVVSFLETLFSFSADVLYDPAYDQPAVTAQIQQTLANTYSFPNRTFGQGVSADEISSTIQGVAGVVAVNVTNLQPGNTSSAGDLAGQGGAFTLSKLNKWLAGKVPTPDRPSSPDRICAYLPVPSLTSQPTPAEILVLDPNPNNVKLGVMS
jgi:hypothetical protein